jgi:hypothetical protein
MSVMMSVRRAIRWVERVVGKPFRWYQHPTTPRRVASQVYANGARMTLFTQGEHAVLYSNGDYVRFGKDNKVIAIKTHDGVKWKESKEKINVG